MIQTRVYKVAKENNSKGGFSTTIINNNVSGGSLNNVEIAEVKNITADIIKANNATINKITASSIESENITSKNVTSDTIKADAAEIFDLNSENITSNSVVSESISSTNAEITTINAETANVNTGVIVNADITNADITNADISDANITNADIETGTVKTLNSDNAYLTNITSTSINNSGTIDTNELIALVADIAKLTSKDITVENLTVTKAAHFFKLIIDEIKASQGSVIITPANAVIDKVEVVNGNYRCYFRCEQDNKKIYNSFESGDQVICQTFNAATGTSYNVSNKFYWRLCTGTGSTKINDIEYHYVDLSDTDKDASTNGVPEAGDNIVMLGNRNDKQRQSAIVIAAYQNAYLDNTINTPYIAQYYGINDYSLATHRRSVISRDLNEFQGTFKTTSGKDIEEELTDTKSYVHIAYASSADGKTGFSKTYFTDATYMGICSNFKESDSDLIYSNYIWSRIRGVDGTNGKDGTDGKDGTSVTISSSQTKYAQSATQDRPAESSFTTTVPTLTKGYYLWTLAIVNYSDGTTTKSYSISRIGADGSDGIDGADGADGKTTYLHIAYANSADGSSNFSTTYFTGAKYIGTYTDFTKADSTSYSKYTWSVFKGDKGDKGDNATIKSTSVTYALTSTSTQPADSAFTYTSIPSLITGYYLWIKTIVTYSDNTTVKSYNVSRIGTDGSDGINGADGADGQTSYLHIAYANSADGRIGFSTTYFTGAKYIGTYTDFTKEDSTSYSDYTWAVLKGDKGDSITIKSTVVRYAVSKTSNQPADSSFTYTSIPNTVSPGDYLWTKTTITYSDDTSVTTYSVSFISGEGAKGDQGEPGTPGEDAVYYKLIPIIEDVAVDKNSTLRIRLEYNIVKVEGTTITNIKASSTSYKVKFMPDNENKYYMLSYESTPRYLHGGFLKNYHTAESKPIYITVYLYDGKGNVLDQRIVPVIFDASATLEITDSITATVTGNKTDVDNQIKSVKNSISEVKQQADSISSTVSTHTTNINTINNSISSIKTDVSNITQKADSISTTVASHTTSINDLTGKVETNTSDISSLTQTAKEIKTNVSSNTTSINNLTTKVDNNMSSITQRADSIESKVTSNTTSINNLTGKVDTNTSNISSLTQTANEIKTSVSNNTTKITNLNTKVDGNMSSITQRADSIQALVSGNTTSINNLTGKVDTNTSNISTVTQKADSIEQRVIAYNNLDANIFKNASWDSVIYGNDETDMFEVVKNANVLYYTENNKQITGYGFKAINNGVVDVYTSANSTVTGNSPYDSYIVSPIYKTTKNKYKTLSFNSVFTNSEYCQLIVQEVYFKTYEAALNHGWDSVSSYTIKNINDITDFTTTNAIVYKHSYTGYARLRFILRKTSVAYKFSWKISKIRLHDGNVQIGKDVPHWNDNYYNNMSIISQTANEIALKVNEVSIKLNEGIELNGDTTVNGSVTINDEDTGFVLKGSTGNTQIMANSIGYYNDFYNKSNTVQMTNGTSVSYGGQEISGLYRFDWTFTRSLGTVPSGKSVTFNNATINFMKPNSGTVLSGTLVTYKVEIYEGSTVKITKSGTTSTSLTINSSFTSSGGEIKIKYTVAAKFSNTYWDTSSGGIQEMPGAKCNYSISWQYPNNNFQLIGYDGHGINFGNGSVVYLGPLMSVIKYGNYGLKVSTSGIERYVSSTLSYGNKSHNHGGSTYTDTLSSAYLTEWCPINGYAIRQTINTSSGGNIYIDLMDDVIEVKNSGGMVNIFLGAPSYFKGKRILIKKIVSGGDMDVYAGYSTSQTSYKMLHANTTNGTYYRQNEENSCRAYFSDGTYWIEEWLSW